MKVAWLCPEIPYPPNSGGRVLLYNRLLGELEHGHEVYLFIAAKELPDKKAERKLREQFGEVRIYPRRKRVLLDVAKSLLFRRPFCVQNRYFAEMDADVNSIHPDVIVAEMPQMLLNLTVDTCNRIPVVLEQQNIEWETSLSLAKSCAKFSLKRLAYSSESRNLRRFEENIYQKRSVKKMVFIAKDDYERYEFAKGVDKVLVEPGATDYFSESNTRTRRCTFVANYSYKPNADAAEWFMDNVVDRITAMRDDVQFVFVGKEPTDHMLDNRGGSVTVTGFVDDLRPYYASSELIFIPIRSGGGVKMKVLEAASTGRPIISTSFALRNTGLIGGEHAAIAEDADGFAATINRVLDYPDSYRAIASAARELYLEKFSWTASNNKWHDAVYS